MLYESHSTRVRGLKCLLFDAVAQVSGLSHSTRVRGLK